MSTQKTTFDTDHAVSDIETALLVPLRDSLQTTDAGDPVTGEWTSTLGDGFLLFPLWGSDDLIGVYAPEWNDAEEIAEGHEAALVAELDRRWGPHRKVSMGPALWEPPTVEPFRTLVANDCLGDLTVWGPVSASNARWVAISLNQSDGDAPMILTALITDRPIT